jgi:hypothetical protein
MTHLMTNLMTNLMSCSNAIYLKYTEIAALCLGNNQLWSPPAAHSSVICLINLLWLAEGEPVHLVW